LTNQYAGVQFTNALILTAGFSLNDSEFPPHSGTNVACNSDGPIEIVFATPVTDVDAYFTYSDGPLTLSAFDSGASLLDTATSLFSNNEALSGDPGSSANELISFGSTAGISAITIAGDHSSASLTFTMDDLSYAASTGPSAATPEPSPISMLVTGLIAIWPVLKLKENRFTGRRGCPV
jgi:hypothetical protein